MTQREKLIELIDKLDVMAIPTENFRHGLADYLIGNGVVVRDKGYWVQSGTCEHKPYRVRNTDKWTTYKCSVCGYGNGRRFNTNFCPNCGADMRGDKR